MPKRLIIEYLSISTKSPKVISIYLSESLLQYSPNILNSTSVRIDIINFMKKNDNIKQAQISKDLNIFFLKHKNKQQILE